MSPGTPRKNDIVEWVFARLYFHIHTIIMHTEIHENPKTVLWPECTATANKLENNTVNPNEEKCAY